MRIWLLCLIAFSACSAGDTGSKKLNHELRVGMLPGGSDYWEFSIIREGKTIVNQTFIPAFPGQQHFYDSTSALVVGRLMKEKLDNGIFPPSLSKSEIIDVWPMNSALPED